MSLWVASFTVSTWSAQPPRDRPLSATCGNSSRRPTGPASPSTGWTGSNLACACLLVRRTFQAGKGGAQTRGFFPPLYLAFIRLGLDTSNQWNLARQEILRATSAWYLELELCKEQQVLPPAASQSLMAQCLRVLQLLTWLCQNQPGCYFIVRPKAHYYRHLSFESRFLNP